MQRATVFPFGNCDNNKVTTAKRSAIAAMKSGARRVRPHEIRTVENGATEFSRNVRVVSKRATSESGQSGPHRQRQPSLSQLGTSGIGMTRSCKIAPVELRTFYLF